MLHEAKQDRIPTTVVPTTTAETAASVQITHPQLGRPFLMRRRRLATRWGPVALATDVVMVAVAYMAAGLTSAGWTTTPLPWLIAFVLVVVVFLYARGAYRAPLQPRVLDDCRVVVTATVLAGAGIIAARDLLTSSTSAGTQLAWTWLFATVFLAAGRVALALYLRSARLTRAAGCPALIIGAGRVGRLVAMRLLDHPETGLRPVGFLDKEPLLSREGVPDVPVLGASWDFDRIVADNGIEHVIVTFSTAPTDVVLRLLQRCEQLGIRTSFVPRLYEKSTQRFTVNHLGGLPLITSYSPDPRGWQFAAKYSLDRIGAAIALVLLAPIMVAVAIAVWISLGRPILYRQDRVGRDGMRFRMFKFRSMHPALSPEADEQGRAVERAPGGVEGTDRRTRLGTFIRRTSLDELPQFINALKGQMSLVGPRPERPEFVEVFERNVHRYDERHRVRSGITGYAQVNGLRGKTSLVDRVELDNYYIENWSMWFDFKIMLQTLTALSHGRNIE